MHKLFSLVLVLAAYGTKSAFAETDPYALQKMGFVLGKMDSANINGWTCVPRVWNDGVNTFVSFTTDIGNAKPEDVCNGMKAYMVSAVGDATSTFSGEGASYIMVYKGNYNSSLTPPGPLKALADVIRNYENPILGNYTCTQKVFQTKSGWAYVGISVPLEDDDNYQDACNNVYEYLRGQGYLDQTSRKISFISDAQNGDYGLLELWANE